MTRHRNGCCKQAASEAIGVDLLRTKCWSARSDDPSSKSDSTGSSPLRVYRLECNFFQDAIGSAISLQERIWDSYGSVDPSFAATQRPTPRSQRWATWFEPNKPKFGLACVGNYSRGVGRGCPDANDDAQIADFGLDSLISLVLSQRLRQELKLEIRDAFFLEISTFGDLKALLG
jgi:hypothetical protein